MSYTIKAHETLYNGVVFRSRLEARWAAFFDIVGWEWEYEPLDLRGWTPDFRVKFKCGHSECHGYHILLVEVKPYHSIDEFEGHPCLQYPYGGLRGSTIPADSSAAFGANPDVTWWEMAHGSGGGVEAIKNGWVDRGINIDLAWKQAGFMTRYNPAVEGEAPFRLTPVVGDAAGSNQGDGQELPAARLNPGRYAELTEEKLRSATIQSSRYLRAGNGRGQ